MWLASYAIPMEESVRQALEHMDELRCSEQQSVIWRMFDRTLALTPFTQLSNITGAPAIGLPCLLTEKAFRIGVQLMAARGQEGVAVNGGRMVLNAKGNLNKRLQLG